MPNTTLANSVSYRGKIYEANTTNYPLAAVLGCFAGITLLGVSGTVSIKGFFRDSRGRRIGNSFAPSTPVPMAGGTPVSFLSYLGIATTPSDANDFLIVFSDGDFYYDTNDFGDTDFQTNYLNYPIVVAVTGRGDITPFQGLQ